MSSHPEENSFVFSEEVKPNLSKGLDLCFVFGKINTVELSQEELRKLYQDLEVQAKISTKLLVRTFTTSLGIVAFCLIPLEFLKGCSSELVNLTNNIAFLTSLTPAICLPILFRVLNSQERVAALIEDFDEADFE